MRLLAAISKFVFGPKCEHPTYRENLACHCICTRCRADLGFIGSITERFPNSKNIGYTAQVHRAEGWAIRPNEKDMV